MKDFQAKQIEKEIPSKQAAWPFPGSFGAYQEKLKAEEEMVKPRVLDKEAWESALDYYEHSSFWFDPDRNGKKVSRPVEQYPKIMEEVLEKDPKGKKLSEPGAKADAGKNKPWLMLQGFARALEEVSKATTEGALKYTENGWVSVPGAQERYMNAFGRHLFKYGKGEIFDIGETGCYHIAQCIWNLLAVFELQLREAEGQATGAYVNQ